MNKVELYVENYNEALGDIEIEVVGWGLWNPDKLQIEDVKTIREVDMSKVKFSPNKDALLD